jgi:hypothetical protein
MNEEAQADWVVEIKDLVKAFGSFQAVDHISLQVSRPERGRQIHHHPYALRHPPAHLRRGEGRGL